MNVVYNSICTVCLVMYVEMFTTAIFCRQENLRKTREMLLLLLLHSAHKEQAMIMLVVVWIDILYTLLKVQNILFKMAAIMVQW